jgi:hypothetical protein
MWRIAQASLLISQAERTVLFIEELKSGSAAEIHSTRNLLKYRWIVLLNDIFSLI